MYLDPMRTRLSDSFLLSDFMGCTSIYRKGLRNQFHDDAAKLREGRLLAETLEEISRLCNSPLSIIYGFISDDVSWEIVKYQDPSKPSYHRWDYGAAADFCAHNYVRGKPNDLSNAPISLAWGIDEAGIGYSRMITYSESPIICFATRSQEKAPRKAFYENRYEGEIGAKPKFIRMPVPGERREKAHKELLKEGLPGGWKGHGFPTYHINGVRGYEHYRTSRYTLLSDFLYDNCNVFHGKTVVPKVNRELRDVMRHAGAHIDTLVEAMGGKRISVVRGFHPTWYSKNANLIVAFPASEHENRGDYAKLLEDSGCKIKVNKEFLHIDFPEMRLRG